MAGAPGVTPAGVVVDPVVCDPVGCVVGAAGVVEPAAAGGGATDVGAAGCAAAALAFDCGRWLAGGGGSGAQRRLSPKLPSTFCVLKRLRLIM